MSDPASRARSTGSPTRRPPVRRCRSCLSGFSPGLALDRPIVVILAVEVRATRGQQLESPSQLAHALHGHPVEAPIVHLEPTQGGESACERWVDHRVHGGGKDGNGERNAGEGLAEVNVVGLDRVQAGRQGNILEPIGRPELIHLGAECSTARERARLASLLTAKYQRPLPDWLAVHR